MEIFNKLKKPLPNHLRVTLLLYFPLICFLGVIIANDPQAFDNFIKIQLSPAILLTDYLEVGGIAGTLINVGIISLMNILLFYYLKLPYTGLMFAAFFTIFGFSFLGMTMVNLIPIYLGGLLYSRYAKIRFRSIIMLSVFAGTLGPIVSHLIFGYGFTGVFAWALGITVGIILGFFVVPIARHLLKFHDGFNLYNIGFAAGIIGIVFVAIMRSFGYSSERVVLLYQSHNSIILIMLFISCLYLIAVGYFSEKELIKKWKLILPISGRAISDFTEPAGFGATLFNMGLVGLISTTLVLILGGVVNGFMLAAIYTIIGFGAFGKHPKNIWPIFTGAILSSLALGLPLSSTTTLGSILFATTLVPIAGVYGTGWGIVAGFLHVFVVRQVGDFHGGLNLYNNGFAGGLVAGVLIIIIQTLKGGEK
ncbi:MAG: DUF1576 domain-containing protein [Erysipelothrix sp.]|nr:DUF1576 domain-containing protein [Erysipelothrix sp.]